MMEVVVVTTGALSQRVTTNKPALNFLQALCFHTKTFETLKG